MAVVCMDDYYCQQIVPMVMKDSVADVVRASMISSYLWPPKFRFTLNMRLHGLMMSTPFYNIKHKEGENKERIVMMLHLQR
jgi:hypothetical protein